MLPCDVHRDRVIESYKKHDFMLFTKAMLYVSQQLHQVPDDSRKLVMQLDVLEMLQAVFPFHTDLQNSLVGDTPDVDRVEIWSQKHHASGIWTIYKEKWMPLIYDLVLAEWQKRPFAVAERPFQRLGTCVMDYLYSIKWPDSYFQAPTECPICFDFCFVKRITTPCKHSFHAACLNNWIQRRKKTCPVCRFPVIRG